MLSLGIGQGDEGITVIATIEAISFYGQMADMDPIMEIARSHGLYIIEDASQAHAAEYKGKPAGYIGDVGCFSFYPGKISAPMERLVLS